MELFKNMARKSLAQKSMGKRMIGAIGIKAVQDFFDDPNIEGFIRFSTLYIKTQRQDIKIKAFRQKSELLKKVNEELEILGYTREITDIRF